MNKEEIKKKYNSKIKEFNKHNKLYYDKSNQLFQMENMIN